MQRQEIFLQLKSIIRKYLDDDIDISSTEESTNFLSDLNLDSVHLINLIVDIEEKFGITIEEEELENINLVKDVIDLISKSSTGNQE